MLNPIPEVFQRVRVLCPLQDKQQEGEDQREDAALHSLLRKGYIAPVANVGAITCGAAAAAAGSSTVILHNVRGSSGSMSVAE